MKGKYISETLDPALQLFFYFKYFIVNYLQQKRR